MIQRCQAVGEGLTQAVLTHRFSLCLVFLSLLLLSGCAAPVGDSANAFDHYLNEDVTAMLTAPNETEPKEVELNKGTRVRLVERGSAMVLIETMKGEQGRVPAIALEATNENAGDEPQAKMGKTILW